MIENYIGIDPGLTGAMAVISSDGSINVFDAPIGIIGKKNVLLAAFMRYYLEPYDPDSTKVAIEAVHSMPRQGVTSAFNFGKGFGLWIGILVGLGFAYTEVPHQRWKASMMDGMGKDKDASRVRAMQLFPQISNQLNLKKHHGRAD